MEHYLRWGSQRGVARKHCGDVRAARAVPHPFPDDYSRRDPSLLWVNKSRDVRNSNPDAELRSDIYAAVANVPPALHGRVLEWVLGEDVKAQSRGDAGAMKELMMLPPLPLSKARPCPRYTPRSDRTFFSPSRTLDKGGGYNGHLLSSPEGTVN
jgi:hypothetical protein